MQGSVVGWVIGFRLGLPGWSPDPGFPTSNLQNPSLYLLFVQRIPGSALNLIYG